MGIGDMLVAGQCMADQNGIGFIGIERAIGLVSDGQRRQSDARIHHQRAVCGKPQHE